MECEPIAHATSPTRAWPLFAAGCLVGALFAVWWLYFGEPWEVLADGRHYVAMYRGEIAAAPYAYRVLEPAIARLLPWNPQAGFAVVTISCLILTSGILALYAARTPTRWFRAISISMLWGLSFPFAYLATTQVRAEAPALCLLAIAVLLSRQRAHLLVLAALIALGSLSHEMMLIFIPALWLDRLVGGDLTGGARYRYRELLILTLIAIAFFIAIRRSVPILSGQVSYATTSPLEMFRYVLAYSGGPIKHGLRIYAAFGPTLIFAVLFLAAERRSPNTKVFLGLALIAVAATFMATDTLRVLELIYLPITLYSAAYLTGFWQQGQRTRTVLLVATHTAFAAVVFGHLRTFESSQLLNRAAGFLSLAALVLCLVPGRKPAPLTIP